MLVLMLRKLTACLAAALLLVLPVLLLSQTVTTSVTLNWTYSFGSEVMCNATVTTLCDDHWSYGTVVSSVYSELGTVALPAPLLPNYTLQYIASSASNTVLTLVAASSSVPPVYPQSVTITGATGTGCSGLNGTFQILPNLVVPTISLNTSGCTYTSNSGTVVLQYTTTFYTTLSGSTTFAIEMVGRDGAGNMSAGSYSSSEVTMTLPSPASPSSFSSGNPSNVAGSHVP